MDRFKNYHGNDWVNDTITCVNISIINKYKNFKKLRILTPNYLYQAKLCSLFKHSIFAKIGLKLAKLFIFIG